MRVQSDNQLAQPEQDRDALASHRDGESGPDAERRQVHHVLRVAEHYFGQRSAERDHRRGLGADRRAGGAEQEGEDHDLQHVVAGHGVDDARRERVLHDRGERGGSGGRHRVGSRARDRDAIAGTHQIDHAQPQEQRKRSDDFEIEDGLGADSPHVFEIAAAGDSGHERAEQQRRDDGTDQAQKHGAHQAELLGDVRGEDAERHAGRHADEDPGRQR